MSGINLQEASPRLIAPPQRTPSNCALFVQFGDKEIKVCARCLFFGGGGLGGG